MLAGEGANQGGGGQGVEFNIADDEEPPGAIVLSSGGANNRTQDDETEMEKRRRLFRPSDLLKSTRGACEVDAGDTSGIDPPMPLEDA